MDPFAVSHLSNDVLIHDLKVLVARDYRCTAVLLTRIGEIEDRRLFRQEGFPSMLAYCVRGLHLSEDAANKRINAARIARRFPAVLMALAEGRMHLRAILMLAPYLTAANADELVEGATYKTRFELEETLARRFPRPDLPEQLLPVSVTPFAVPMEPDPGPVAELAPERVAAIAAEDTVHGFRTTPSSEAARELAPERVAAIATEPTVHGFRAARPSEAARELAPERVAAMAPPARIAPLAPERFGLQVTVDRETYELLQHVRALMSHEVPTGETALVLKGALKLAAGELEKRKYAATDRPGRSRGCTSARRIPAAVKRAVRERDGEQCTFVSDSGQRCPARAPLETIWNDGLAVVRSCHLREEKADIGGTRPPSIAG